MTCKNCGHSYASPSGALDGAKIQTTETTEVRSWTALPLLDVTNVPDDLDLLGGSNKEFQSWRIPASYFLGKGFQHNQYTIAGAFVMPERQVVPVRFSAGSLSPAIEAKAVTGETATDLVVESDGEKFVIMKNGYYTFDRPHMYEVGKTYYLSQNDAGEVVSVKPNAGIIQPLFSVVDQLTISINVALGA